jgi:hypothetical protein
MLWTAQIGMPPQVSGRFVESPLTSIFEPVRQQRGTAKTARGRVHHMRDFNYLQC